MKKIYLFALLVNLVPGGILQAQSSAAILSIENVVEIEDPLNKKFTFLAAIKVNSPASLIRIDALLTGDLMNAEPARSFYLHEKEQVVYMSIGEYDVPFTNNIIQIPVEIIGRVVDPAWRLTFTGYDSSGKPTNTVDYKKR
jgi:hypothetical protein